MQIVWLVLRIAGMALVLSECASFVRGMALVQELTGNATPLMLTIVGCIVVVVWAYKVIWRPIRPGA